MKAPKIGELVTGPAARDAIHVAVIPVVAGQILQPGDHVGFDAGRAVTSARRCIGIVDPFLRSSVPEGARFWLHMYPGTVTSIRHSWGHPDVEDEDEAAVEDDLVKLRGVAASEAWLRSYVARHCPYYYDEGVEGDAGDGYRTFLGNALDGRIHYSGTDLHDISDCADVEELMQHLSIVLGRPFNSANMDYTCSC